MEWDGFALDGPADGHLGLGFELALRAVNRRARTAQEMAALVRPAPESASVFPSTADVYFRLHRHPVAGEVRIAPGFAIYVVTRGPLEIGGTEYPTGSTLLVPHADGEVLVTGAGEVLVARPPAP